MKREDLLADLKDPAARASVEAQLAAGRKPDWPRAGGVILQPGGSPSVDLALTRRWAEGPPLVVCMLNPSTADAEEDDPTIRRCVGFAKRDGFAALEVVNLFAFRATDPKAMWAAAIACAERWWLDEENARSAKARRS